MLRLHDVEAADPEPGVTRVLTDEGWETSMYIDPGDDWHGLEDGSWASPDGRTRSWPLAGAAPRSTRDRDGSRTAASLSPLTLLLFPRDDSEFAGHCKELAQTTRDPHVAEQWLRRRYPHAVVRPRHPLGSIDGKTQAWYVYRDGAPSSHAS